MPMIWIMENFVYSSQLWEELFNRREGYHAVRFEHPSDVLQSLKEGLRYDYAIVDMSLPGIPGDFLVKYMKRIYPQGTIIAVSAFPGINVEADYFLKKPFRISELEELVFDQD